MIESLDSSWTLFLDRDGVINERIFDGYVTEIDEFIFRKDFLEAIPSLSQRFGRIIVVTNQQGVGKGLMSERNLLAIHNYMVDEIQKCGGRIDAVFAATNLKGSLNDRRKPQTAMGLEAKAKFPEIDFSKSVMIGDTDSDISFGKNLGMKTACLLSDEKISIQADFELKNLTDWIK